MTCYTKKDMHDILKYNGFVRENKNNGGNHEKWYRDEVSIPLPMNKKDLNPALCYGLIKRNSLKIPPKLKR